MQDGGGATQGQCLVRLSGGIHGNAVAGSEQFAHLLAQFFTQFVIQVDQWFVEQNQLGILDQRAGHGRALLLTTGQLQRQALQEGLDAQHLRRLMHFVTNLLFVHTRLTER
ncbi:hypothetical protein D3C81_635120 [compost metagenome]